MAKKDSRKRLIPPPIHGANKGPTTPGDESKEPEERSPWQQGYDRGVHNERERQKYREADAEKREQIIVEFGDGTITFRDGFGVMLKRCALASWTEILAELLAARGADFDTPAHFSAHISEHARFSTLEHLRSAIVARRKAGAGRGMALPENPE